MGATVVLTARDQARLAQVKTGIEQHGGKAFVLPCDLTDANAVAALGEQVRKEHGRCDILVNNAGVGVLRKPLIDLPVEEWDKMMHTNLRAPYLMIRNLAPLMIAAKSGHIINISSLAGKNSLPEGAAYSASKWGLNGLTYSVAEELRQYNVRVSVIAPGSVNTHFGGGGSTKDRGPNDSAGRCRPGSGHAGHPGAHLVRQRSSAPANDEAVVERIQVVMVCLTRMIVYVLQGTGFSRT